MENQRGLWVCDLGFGSIFKWRVGIHGITVVDQQKTSGRNGDLANLHLESFFIGTPACISGIFVGKNL